MAEIKKASVAGTEAFRNNSLTMSYFHTGIRTIIGAEAFHCPVRDGKAWFQRAIATRQFVMTSRIVFFRLRPLVDIHDRETWGRATTNRVGKKLGM